MSSKVFILISSRTRYFMHNLIFDNIVIIVIYRNYIFSMWYASFLSVYSLISSTWLAACVVRIKYLCLCSVLPPLLTPSPIYTLGEFMYRTLVAHLVQIELNRSNWCRFDIKFWIKTLEFNLWSKFDFKLKSIFDFKLTSKFDVKFYPKK